MGLKASAVTLELDNIAELLNNGADESSKEQQGKEEQGAV